MIEKYYCYTLDEQKTMQNYEKDDEIVELFTSEHDLLTKFYQKYAEISPDILSGWNSEFFDIPYLYNRSVNVLGREVAMHNMHKLDPRTCRLQLLFLASCGLGVLVSVYKPP